MSPMTFKTAIAASAAALALVLSACTSTFAGHPVANGPTRATGAERTGAAFPTGPAASGSPSPAPQHSAGSTSTTNQSCTLPVTHETDDGFHIGVPSGWDVSTLNGQVVVGSSPTDDEATLVHPVLLSNGLTAAHFFSTYLSTLDQQNAKAGTPVAVHQASGANGLPAVTWTQTVGGTQRQGVATVEVLPLAAPGATQEAAYISYWAPASQFARDAGQLSAVAACYGPDSASPLQIFQDQVFTYALPPGWTPADENSNGIDLHGPDDSDVSYILAGPVQTSEFDSPQTMIGWFLHGVGISAVSSLTSVASSPQPASNGGTAAVQYEQFAGTSGGSAVRGLIFASTVTGGGVSSGYIRMAEASAAGWNSLNGSMLQIAGSIQHNFTQDLQQLQQVNQQWQDFSGQVADFDDTLNNQQLVRDPSTGIDYEAPYSDYDPNGPQGPGYYLPNGDPLNPVSR